jgi:hypothetical protein
MSILETFYILFKSDTTELKKGTEEAKKTTDKLTESIKASDVAVEHIGRSFQSFAGYLTSAVAAFISVGAVVGGLKDAITYDIELGRTSKALGVNVSQLDAWGQAVQRTGGTASGFQNSLKSLADHFNTTASVAIKALPQLADALSKVSRFSAFKFGKSLGLDEATILLLQQGRREVESILKQQKELGVVTKEQIDIAIKYDNSLANLNHSFRTLYNAIAIPLAPYLITFMEKFTKAIQYLTAHKDLITGALYAIGAAFGVIALPIIIATAPIILMTGLILGLIALFAILFEDFKVDSAGGQSALHDWWVEWRKFFKWIGDKWDWITEKLQKFLNLIRGKTVFSLMDEANKNSIAEGNRLASIASNTPINTQTSSNIVNSQAFARNSSINTGPITINTKATDAEGVAKDLDINLKYQLRDTTNYFADNTYA